MRIEKKIAIDIDVDAFVKDLVVYDVLKKNLVDLTDLTEKDLKYLDFEEFYYQVGSTLIKNYSNKNLKNV